GFVSPGASWRKLDEALPMLDSATGLSGILQSTGEMKVDVGVIGKLLQGPFEGGHRQLGLPALGQDAPQIRSRLDQIRIDLKGYKIALASPAQIPLSVEQLCQLETQVGGGTPGGHGRAQPIHGAGQI